MLKDHLKAAGLKHDVLIDQAYVCIAYVPGPPANVWEQQAIS